MNATERRNTRRKLDAYYTPDAVATACVATLPPLLGLSVLEPSVGGGAFARAASVAGASRLHVLDIDPAAAGLLCGESVVGDFLGDGCAFLLRLAFLESVKRRPFWEQHPPAAVYVFTRRPSFTGGRTDSAAYGWFIWCAHYGPPVLRWLEW